MKIVLILVLLMFFIVPLSAQGEETVINSRSGAEEEIWYLEENYISYFGEADHQAILSLYHSSFLGWPDSELHPAGRDRAAKYLEEKHPASKKVVYEIIREGIRIEGDVAITHYLVLVFWNDEHGVEQKGKSRITHTWIKDNDQWKILGGMSNRQ
jgi:ketosteroid isomerase-like protein